MRLMSAACILILGLGLTAFFLIYIQVGLFHPRENNESITFLIKKGESLYSISRRLKKQKMIISRSLFNYAARLKKLDKTIKYGEFVLTNKMSTDNILKKITSNEYLKYDIFVKNCITGWELIDYFRQKAFLFDDLPNYVLREGEFAPDTYTVGYQTNFSKLLELMRRKQSNILENEWKRRKSDLPIKNQFEMLTLASIIEREASTVSEMPKIASVFINRLRTGMRLQSDPTVIYGMDLGNISKRKELKRSHLKVFTDHNTYRIEGLPISPICNPSKSAIKAAANPLDTDYFYFVMSEFGYHIFSKTFNEHKKNVINWRNFKSNK